MRSLKSSVESLQWNTTRTVLCLSAFGREFAALSRKWVIIKSQHCRCVWQLLISKSKYLSYFPYSFQPKLQSLQTSGLSFALSIYGLYWLSNARHCRRSGKWVHKQKSSLSNKILWIDLNEMAIMR